jgi:hypothetical protein
MSASSSLRRAATPDPGGEGKTPNKLRVAPFSNDTHGFANITTVTIGPATQKVTVILPGQLQRHLVPAPGRPGQLGHDRLQPGRLNFCCRLLPAETRR